eukprot:gene3196-5925_t
MSITADYLVSTSAWKWSPEQLCPVFPAREVSRRASRDSVCAATRCHSTRNTVRLQIYKYTQPVQRQRSCGCANPPRARAGGLAGWTGRVDETRGGYSLPACLYQPTNQSARLVSIAPAASRY